MEKKTCQLNFLQSQIAEQMALGDFWQKRCLIEILSFTHGTCIR